MWLDADGSMSPESAIKLILRYKQSENEVVIGSRFVDGGGYKGVQDLSNNSFIKSIKNINKSKDTVSGMIASTLFNKLLNLILNIEIKDLTSGFIVGKKHCLKNLILRTCSTVSISFTLYQILNEETFVLMK